MIMIVLFLASEHGMTNRRCTPETVRAVFDRLQDRLGSSLDFSYLFPVILTDRSVELRNPDALEKAPDGTARTSIYYCAPCGAFKRAALKIYTQCSV